MPDIPKTGPEAIEYALQQLTVEDIEKRAKEDLATGKKTKRSNAVALLNIAKGMRRNKLTPADYMIHAVPVIPPKYRPFAAQGDSLIPGDANVLYKDLFDIRDAYEEEREVFGDENVGQSRLALYDAIKSVYGYGDPVKPKTKAKDVKGFLKKIVGTTAKHSFFQSKMLAKTQDNVGRSTITVNPELGIDEIELPEEMAFTMYAPYVQRRLKQLGLSDADALKQTKDRTDYAKHALNQVLEERPVVYSRAPAWHAHSVLAGKAKVHDGKEIRTNPYVAAGLGADYDGDLVNACIVVSYDKEELRNSLNNEEYDKLMVTFVLTTEQINSILTGMFTNTNIPTLDSNKRVVLLQDLQDFKHGTYSNSVKGAKGDIHFYNALPGTQVLSYDPLTGSVQWKDVAYWSEHPDREIEIVTLKNKKQIFTDDDPRAVYGVACSSETLIPERFTPTQALEQKVLVPVAKYIPSIEDANALTSVETSCGTINLDFKCGQLLGMLAGDGWWDKKDYHRGSKKRYLHLADEEGDNGNYLAYAITEVLHPESISITTYAFNKETDIKRYGATVRYTYSFDGCDEFTKVLSEWLGGESDANTTGSGNKHLPAFYLTANKEFRKGLLCGLMATDGTCAISNAKGKPQLMLAITTTSFRLAREVRLLCTSLNISASVSFSKKTSRGNDAWCVTISTIDAKRENIFATMAHIRKRDIFLTTEVSTDPEHIKYDTVPYIPALDAVIRPFLYCPKYINSEADKAAYDVYHSVTNKNVSDNTVSRFVAGRLIDWLHETYKAQLQQQQDAINYLQSDKEECNTDTLALVRTALCNTALASVDGELYTAMMKVYNRTKRITKTGKMGRRLKNGILEWFYTHAPQIQAILEHPLFTSWKRIYVDQKHIYWSAVTSVEKTGKIETGYDLTVPGYETFMNSEGVILSNTINVHVPSSDDAVKEAYEKLMPSKTPFSDRVPGKIVPLPKQEQILGLYTAATAPKTRPIIFNSEEEALSAIRKGEVPLSADIEIAGHRKSASAEKEETEDKKEKLLAEMGPIRNPKNGQFMPTARDKSVPMAKEAAEKTISFALNGIKQGQRYKIKTRQIWAPIPVSAKAAVEEAKEAFDKGNIKPAMKLIRKYTPNKYPSDLFILAADELIIKYN